ncbi:MAG: aminoacyl-tRNA deacylase [Chloroflexota bacterium]
MVTTTILPGPHAGLLRWLAGHGIRHLVHEHRVAFTAPGTARAEGVDPHTFVKVVGVRSADGRITLVAVEAQDHVDLRKLRRVLGRGEVRLLTEDELAALAPDCEPGAIPAVGPLFGLPVLADLGLRDASAVSFNAGSHRYAVRVDRAAWEHAAGIMFADIAGSDDTRPAWVLS